MITGEKGTSGTPIFSGRIEGPRGPGVTPQSMWPAFCDEMFSQNEVASGWRALKNTLLSAKFKVKPGPTQDPKWIEESKWLADLMNQNLGLAGHSGTMEESFETVMGQILQYVPVGFRYLEDCWEIRPDGRVFLSGIRDRIPRTHDQWVTWPVDSEGERIPDDGAPLGHLRGVRQNYVYGDAVSVQATRPFIPANKILLFTHERDGQNYNGNGLLRSCERSYISLQAAEEKLLHYLRTRNVPIIKVTDVDNEDPAGPLRVDEKLRRTSAGLMDAAWGRAAFVVAYQGVDIGDQLIVDQEPERALAIKQAYQQEISRTFFVQFLQLGISDTGSRAVGDVQESFFRRAALNILDYVVSVFNGRDRPGGGLVGRFVDNNWGPDVPDDVLPVLTHEGLAVDPVLEQFEHALSAYDKGLLGPITERDIQHFREVVKMPALETQGSPPSPQAPEGTQGSAPAPESPLAPQAASYSKVPRSSLPQLSAAATEATVALLRAKGIEVSEETVDPKILEYTQLAVNGPKVRNLIDSGLDPTRTVIVSSDNKVLDGHHFVCAMKAEGLPVHIYRVDLPMEILCVHYCVWRHHDGQ